MRSLGLGSLVLGGLGGLVGLVSLFLALARLSRLGAQARQPVPEAWRKLLEEMRTRVGIRRPVRLLRGRGTTPMTWGSLRPVILLPETAVTWSESQLRMVLLHELAHIRQHDHLAQILARMVCALHWFNPLAWGAARRLAVEREKACDSAVL